MLKLQNFLSNSCDGNGPHGGKDIRVLPIGGDSNLLVCHYCFVREIDYRIERNRGLSNECKFDLPSWKNLKIYLTV
jgi:hypothetical protein